MIIDYTIAVECSNPEVFYTCYQCGKCGRVFEDGIMIDDIENAYSLGDKCDIQDWMRLLKELKGEAK